MRIVNAVATALNSSPDVATALEKSLALVGEWLGFDTGWVWLLDHETGQFYNAVARQLPPYLREPVRMAGGECWCLRLFREGRLMPTNIDLIGCSRLGAADKTDPPEATQGLRFHASIPLYFGDKPLGIMNVASPSWRELTGEELRILSTIAHQIGVAIERARLAEQAASLDRAEERARIAREIHDTLAQGLTAIVLNVESAMTRLRSDPEGANDRLEQALSAARESLDEARRSVLDLREGAETRPLREAVAAMARALTSETGIRVRLQAPEMSEIPRRAEAELIRIVGEAFANVRRHSQATEVSLTLAVDRGWVRLTIRDNGRGFDPRTIPEDRQGIAGMRERARLLGGQLRIDSREGRGVSLSVKAPLPDLHREIR